MGYPKLAEKLRIGGVNTNHLGIGSASVNPTDTRDDG